MEKLGSPRFFTSHSSSVRSVAFNPVERYLFCSGGNDGNICVYHAGRAEVLNVYSVINSGLNRHINACRFTSDGKKILTITTSRRLSVLDTERGVQINSYENCAFSGRDRAALANDPSSPHYAASSYVNGKGLTMYDLRMPLPLDFHFDLHQDPIRDIQYLDDSWPFNKPTHTSIMTLSSTGTCKISNAMDGNVLYSFDFNHATNSIVATPEPFGSAAIDGFPSALVAGGTVISSYAPAPRMCSLNGSASTANGKHDLTSAEEATINASTVVNTQQSTTRPLITNPPYPSRRHGIHLQSRAAPAAMDLDAAEAVENGADDDDDDDDDEEDNVIQPQPPPRRSEIIFSLEGIRISRNAAAAAAAASGSSSNESSNILRNHHSAAAIRHHIMSHLTNHSNSVIQGRLQQQAPNQAASSSSGSQHTMTISTQPHIVGSSAGSVLANSAAVRTSNLHQFLALNFMPIRSSTTQSYQAQQQPSVVQSAVSPSQILFHDRWDRNSPPSVASTAPSPTRSSNLRYEVINGVNTVTWVHSNNANQSVQPLQPQQILRLRYSSNGAILYAAGEGGAIRRYRQYPGQQMRCLGELFQHRGDVLDMDISPYDEYLVTASKDKTVGLICLGSPNRGWTEYYELT